MSRPRRAPTSSPRPMTAVPEFPPVTASILVSAAVASGGTASTGTNQVTATATGGTDGVDSIAETQYTSDPVGSLSGGNDDYFDIAVSTGSTFSNVVVQDCSSVTTQTVLTWWDPSANEGDGGWALVSGDPGPTYESGSPACLSTTLNSTTSPSIGQLTGTVFASLSRGGVTSASSLQTAAGSAFTFPVTTIGTPAPRITEKGKLPKGVKFHKGTGTATISGTPRSTKHKSAVGTYSLTITATFGKGKNKDMVTQSFTLTVT